MFKFVNSSVENVWFLAFFVTLLFSDPQRWSPFWIILSFKLLSFLTDKYPREYYNHTPHPNTFVTWVKQHGYFINILEPLLLDTSILCFHSRGQHLCKFIGTKESVYIRKEFNSHRTGWGQKHGRRFVVLGHKYGRHDFMWKQTIQGTQNLVTEKCSHNLCICYLYSVDTSIQGKGHFFWVPNPVFNLHSLVTL